MGDGKIDKPAAPKPATPPDLSALGRVKQLLQELRKGPKADPGVVKSLEAQVEALDVGELVQLEKDLPKALSRDEVARYGIDLRNLLRFATKNKSQYKADPKFIMPIPERTKGLSKTVITDLGDKDKARKPGGAPRGKVTLKTFEDGAFDLLFDTADKTDDVFWLQFNWRMLEAYYPGQTQPLAFQRRNTRPGRAYLYTTRRESPRWTVDGGDKAGPFYEGETTAKRTNTSLRIFDLPTPNESFADKLFDTAKPPTNCVSTFHAETYLVWRRKVLYRADLELSWKIPAKGKVEKPVWKAPVGSKTAQVRAGPRGALALQFPGWDYFPGPRIDEPVPMDDLEPLDLVEVRASAWPKAPLDRLKEAAKLAEANLIVDVDDSNGFIHVAENTVVPGLVLDLKISTGDAAGITGYVSQGDSKQVPSLPLERIKPPPGVIMQMGSLAFTDARKATDREREFTLSVLRHEMAHAASNRTSIGWLLAWRDQLTNLDFQKWLDSTLKRGKRKGSEYERALTFIGTHANHATEAFARTEGIVTSLPFLGPLMALKDLAQEANWPAYLFELQGLLKQIPTVDTFLSKAVRVGVDARLQWCLCKVLDDPQRANFKAWTDFLINLDKLTPTPGAEAGAVKLLSAGFKAQRNFLVALRKLVDTCPKPAKP